MSFVLFTHFPEGTELAIVYLALGLLVILLFLISSRKKPGYICINADQNDFDILKKYHPSKICFECMVFLDLFSWSDLNVRGTARSAADA